jgi:FkbM family methyltransferase
VPLMVREIKQVLNFLSHHPIARRRRLRCFTTYLGFQFTQRISPKTRRYKFVNDTVLLAKRGAHGLTGNIYAGLAEFSDMSFLLHVLQPGDRFADVGSNAGVYSILASGVRGAESWAFEPVPRTLEMLKENVLANDLGGLVHVVNKGLGERPGVLRFTVTLDSVNHVVVDGSEEVGIEVEVSTLDNEVTDAIDLMKLDVEGFELPVLRGGKKILEDRSLKAVIVELNGSGKRYGYNDRDIHNFLLAMEFRPYGYEPFGRHLVKLQTFNDDGNTLYLRDMQWVEGRIREAEPFRLMGMNI